MPSRPLPAWCAWLLLAAVVACALVAIGGTAHAAPDEDPAQCATQGNRECGPGTPMGPVAGRCPDGGTVGVGGLGGPVCRYAGSQSAGGGGGRSSKPKAPPIEIPGVNVDVPPLGPDYVDPSWAGHVTGGPSRPDLSGLPGMPPAMARDMAPR